MRMNKAFTLLEVLLGTAIFSIAALSLYGVFASGMKIQKQAQKDDSVYREARWSLDAMSLEIENMRSFDFSNSYPDLLACAGKSDQLTFLMSGPKGLRAVSYYLLSPSQGEVQKTLIGQTFKRNVTVKNIRLAEAKNKYLMRKERSLVDYLNGDPESAVDIEVMAAHIQDNGMKLGYGFKNKEQSQEMKWRDEWTEKTLPLSVRVELRFSDQANSTEGITITKDIFLPAVSTAEASTNAPPI